MRGGTDMKKFSQHINKIMLGLSILFFAVLTFIVGTALFEDAGFSGSDRLLILALVSLSGLFLGLYRIIDLLEKKQ